MMQSGISKPIPSAVPGRMLIGFPPLFVLGSIPAFDFTHNCMHLHEPVEQTLGRIGTFKFLNLLKL